MRQPLESAQYGSLLVGRTLRDAAIIPNMGRVGDPWDNALMESALGYLSPDEYETEYHHTHAAQSQAA